MEVLKEENQSLKNQLKNQSIIEQDYQQKLINLDAERDQVETEFLELTRRCQKLQDFLDQEKQHSESLQQESYEMHQEIILLRKQLENLEEEN